MDVAAAVSCWMSVVWHLLVTAWSLNVVHVTLVSRLHVSQMAYVDMYWHSLTRCLQVFCKQLAATIPNTEFFSRHDQDLKKIIVKARERGYTDCIVINEDRKKPNGMVISHIPDGPTLHFKLTTSKIRVCVRCVYMLQCTKEIITPFYITLFCW